jgi:hypothetical protein
VVAVRGAAFAWRSYRQAAEAGLGQHLGHPGAVERCRGAGLGIAGSCRGFLGAGPFPQIGPQGLEAPVVGAGRAGEELPAETGRPSYDWGRFRCTSHAITSLVPATLPPSDRWFGTSGAANRVLHQPTSRADPGAGQEHGAGAHHRAAPGPGTRPPRSPKCLELKHPRRTVLHPCNYGPNHLPRGRTSSTITWPRAPYCTARSTPHFIKGSKADGAIALLQQRFFHSGPPATISAGTDYPPTRESALRTRSETTCTAAVPFAQCEKTVRPSAVQVVSLQVLTRHRAVPGRRLCSRLPCIERQLPFPG